MDCSDGNKSTAQQVAGQLDYERIFRAIRHPIIILSPDHRILAVNPAVERLTGLTEKQLQGRLCCEVFHGSEHPPKGCPVETLLRQSREDVVEMPMEALGRTFLVSATPIRGPDGNVERIIHVSTDITERIDAERALRARDEQYRLLAEAALDIVFVHDMDGSITYANSAALELMGLEEKDVIGTHISEYLMEEDLRLLERHRLERLAGDTSPRVFEIEVFDRDGNPVPLEVKTGPVLKNGEIVGIQVVARDIRERREMEQKFLQAQKLEAIGRLAAGVAHDFNNLLTTILGYVDLAMVDASEGLASPDLLKEIKAASLKASVLTQRLLAFSRKTVVSPIVIDLNAAISDMGKLLKRVIGEDIELIVERAETELAVRIDPVLFEQVVLNLAINARDAMPEGGKLVIRLRAVDVDEDYAAVHEGISPGRYHELSVSDTGTGMSREVRERIFDPFFTTKEAGKGTGLGLSTVREIVESQGGHIIVYSEVGKGSTFRVLWPPAGEKACTVRADSEQAWPGGNESILVVEDEESVRTVLESGLERAGYRVLTVRDARAALDLLASGQRVDILLSDVVLPGGVDGVRLAERVRAMNDGVKVLLMSGYAGEVLIDSDRLSKYRLLQKPFAMSELLDAVRDVLDS